ncbi:MAG: 30S ribosomal protein S2, partial [Myxococcota bacterium]
FRTVKSSIERLRDLERMEEDGTMGALPKKEALNLRRERDKLYKFIGGIKMMNSLPAAMFVVDPHHEHIAVREGRKLRIPIIALTDTNCDPRQVDFLIPGNDDAIRSIKLITSRLADACLEGAQRKRESAQQQFASGGEAAEGVQVEFSRSRRSRRNRPSGAPGAGAEGAASSPPPSESETPAPQTDPQPGGMSRPAPADESDTGQDDKSS